MTPHTLRRPSFAPWNARPARRRGAVHDLYLRAVKLGIRLSRSIRESDRRARDHQLMRGLDDHVLRDLGVCRSEFQSFVAESHRLAAPTRLRIAERDRHA